MAKSSARIFLVILSISLTLLLSETGMRFYQYYQLNIATFVSVQKKTDFQADPGIVTEIKNKTAGKDLKNSFVIYYLGESTMQGVWDNLNLPVFVSSLIGNKRMDKPIVSVNLAKGATRFEYQLERIKAIASNKLYFNPSLIVVYSGHNEFLTRYLGLGLTPKSENESLIKLLNSSLLLQKGFGIFKKYKLDVDERNFFDIPLYTYKVRQKFILNFKNEINLASDILKSANIPIIYITQVGNFSDYEPNRSIYCNDKIEEKNEFLHFFRDAQKAEAEYNLSAAIISYQSALNICPTFAEVLFRLGKIYQEQNNANAAWKSFRQAVDNDALPIRAITEINDFIRKQKDGKMVFVVDGEKYLRDHSDNGQIGFNLMIDGHHPNQDGYNLLANAVSAKIMEIFPDKNNKTNVLSLEKIPISDDTYIDIAEWLVQMSTWRYDPKSRLKRAENHYNLVLSHNPQKWRAYLGLSLIDFLRKDVNKGLENLQKAKSINQIEVDKTLQSSWVPEVIARALKNKLDK